MISFFRKFRNIPDILNKEYLKFNYLVLLEKDQIYLPAY